MAKKKVVILGFGGTIAMVPGDDGARRPALSIDEIARIVPSLSKMADVEVVQVQNLDSTNITPAHWTELIYKIGEAHPSCDGIIVTHGTDTMAYTSTAVSMALGRGSHIPIVFTGSQVPLLHDGTDARFNLENSMRVLLQAIETGISEVMIVFSERVLRANRTIKTSEARFTAFDSPAYPHLGLITAVGVQFQPGIQRRIEKLKLGIQPHFQRGILTVDIVPGLEPSMLLHVLKSGKCQGLLLKSLGSGNVPSQDEYSMIPIIEAATGTYNVPVLVSTKFVGGQTHMDMYEPGLQALKAGAIPTGDMTDTASQVKLMWALAQGHQVREALREVIHNDRSGEITSLPYN